MEASLKKNSSLPKNSMSQQILLDILRTAGEVYGDSMRSYLHPTSMVFGSYPKISKRNIQQSIYRLKRKRKVKMIKQGRRQFLQLTEVGNTELLKLAIINKEKMMPRDQICLVVFDVPEAVRSVRWAFRNLLKRAGFVQIQKSVWFSRRDVVNELRQLVRIIKLDIFVLVFRVISDYPRIDKE